MTRLARTIHKLSAAAAGSSVRTALRVARLVIAVPAALRHENLCIIPAYARHAAPKAISIPAVWRCLRGLSAPLSLY